MAKRNTEYKAPPPTELIISVDDFKKELQSRIKLGEKILAAQVRSESEFSQNREDYNLWDDYNSEYLKQSFNNEHNEYRDRYDKCTMFIGFTKRAQTPNSKLINFKEAVKNKVSNLKKLLAKSDLLKSSVPSAKPKTKSKGTSKEISNKNKIFIVHGHDERTKLNVARTLEKLDLDPIILAEQPNEGQTIIEKFELHADVGFAIILLTADDLGRVKSEEEDKYRARQNVLLEMGYFIGRLGRNRVFPLYESGVELPSDLLGILYNPLDDSDTWKFRLVKELDSAGYAVDANKLL
ncbi:MAG: hypothetical protein COA32_09565 [Fluviicola sp.]|nr:MAG: hypothetical protein COA32_09565 [Fluviicola sp.]